MQQEALAAFLDMTVGQAVKECAVYQNGQAVHEMKAIDVMALLVFKFAAVTTRSVEAAERAEADFRRRAGVLDASTETAH